MGTSNTAQLTRQMINGFRYQIAINIHGHKVLVQVVDWLYQGGPSIKAHFLSLGHSSMDYKKTFKRAQRTLIESGEPFEKFDISLLYIILQYMCGLSGHNDFVWSTPSTKHSLEYLLYKIKEKRNEIAHSCHVSQMTDKELEKKLRKLKRLLSKILRLSGNRCRIRPNVFRDEVWKMKRQFEDLLEKVREPLEVCDLDKLPQLQQEIQLFQNVLRQKVEEDSRKELHGLYPQLWDVVLAQWLYPSLKMRPSVNFTHLVIKEDISYVPPSQQQPPRDVSHVDLLEIPRRDGRLPEAIIISGDGGMGKTTLLKHMLEMWVTDPSQIKGLQNVSLLLYLQLRGSTISSWKDLLMNLLCKTFQDSGLTPDSFLDLFHSYRIVVLLDGYDEITKESKKLISDLLHYRGNMRIVITTRPGSLKELGLLVNSRKQALTIEIKGIFKNDRLPFIERTLAGIVKNATQRAGLKDKIAKKMDKLSFTSDDLDVPLTLTLLVIREVEDPVQSSQDIYGDLTSLMKIKIEERLVLKGIDEAEDKIHHFFQFQKKVALQSLKRRELDLSPESIEALKEKCKSLKLPFKEVLSGFLVTKKSRQGLFIIHIWSFPHKKFQEYWAGDYVVTQLLKVSQYMPDFTKLTSDISVEDISKTVWQSKDALLTMMFNKNPILHIIANDQKEVGALFKDNMADELLGILCNVSHILALSLEELLGKVAPGIISLLFCRNWPTHHCAGYGDIIMASKEHPSVVKACAKVLQPFKHLHCGTNMLSVAVALLDYLTPLSIHVVMENDRQISSLKALAKKNVEVTLVTNIYQSDSQFSETCLQAVLENDSVCKLTKFEGNLTAAGMHLLPGSLRELKTESSGEAMRSLVTRHPFLQNLHSLDFKGYLTASEIDILPSTLTRLVIKTDGEGLTSLIRRIPLLKNLKNLALELMERPLVGFLSPFLFEGSLVLDFRSVVPPSWEWACEALQKLCGETHRWTRVLVPLEWAETIITGLNERGANLKKFNENDIYFKLSRRKKDEEEEEEERKKKGKRIPDEKISQW